MDSGLPQLTPLGKQILLQDLGFPGGGMFWYKGVSAADLLLHQLSLEPN